MGNSTDTFVLRLIGQRHQRPLQPDTVDAAELADLLLATRKLISGEQRKEIHVPLHLTAGSIVLRYSEDPAIIDTLVTELQSYWLGMGGSMLSPRRFRALEQLLRFVKKTGDSLDLSGPRNLHIELNARTKLPTVEHVWANAEIYLTGKIMNVGGKSASNIHLETNNNDFGTLIIDVPREVLAQQERNRVYQVQTVRITIKQNVKDGSFDRRSARLLEFVDDRITTPAEQQSYLDKLIGRATQRWSEIEDTDMWLRRIRGYEA
jgi:hypothetical protein